MASVVNRLLELLLPVVTVHIVVIGFLSGANRLSGGRVQAALRSSGVTVSPFVFNWHTRRFNVLFARMAGSRGRVWFCVGSFVGALLMLSVPLLLLANLVRLVQPYVLGSTVAGEELSAPLFVPVIPGVNVPTQQLGYYFFTLLVSGVLHEAGHAIAGLSEAVRVQGFGAFVMLVYPGAYCELVSEELDSLSPARRMRVLCAGAWHNLVVAMAAFAALSMLAVLLLPAYSSGSGVVVTEVVENSLLSGHVDAGDLITAAAGWDVSSRQDFFDIFYRLQLPVDMGFCVDPSFTVANDCCDQEQGDNGSVVGRERCFVGVSGHACLDAKYAAVQPRCLVIDSLPTYGQGQIFDRSLFPPCSLDSFCAAEESTASARLQSLITLRVQHAGDEKVVLVEATPGEVWFSLRVTDYVPRLDSVFLPVWFPNFLERQLQYLSSLSVGLGFLNLAPTWFLDGEHAARAMLELFQPRMDQEQREKLLTAIFSFTGLLLSANILLGLTQVLQ